MAIDLTVLASDLQAVAEDMPATLVWTPDGGAEQTITEAMTGDLSYAESTELAGYLDNRDMTVQVRLAAFTGSTSPSVGDKLKVNDAWYRVTGKMLSADRIMVTLDLGRL